jgi:hypothetical protein
MFDGDALISAVAAFLALAVYAYLGARLARRPVPTQLQLPALQFGLFWLTLGALSGLTALESLAAVVTTPPLDVVVTLLYVEVLLLCVLLWALVSYLMFLFTGWDPAIPLAAFYGAIYVLLLYYVTAAAPTGVAVTMGSVAVVTAATPAGGAVAALFVVLLVPEFVGALLYFTLVFRARDPTVRYRITLVSWSLLGWFGLGILNIGSLLGGGFAAALLDRSLGTIAAIVILVAYYPPQGIQRRFGVRSIAQPAPPTVA